MFVKRRVVHELLCWDVHKAHVHAIVLLHAVDQARVQQVVISCSAEFALNSKGSTEVPICQQQQFDVLTHVAKSINRTMTRNIASNITRVVGVIMLPSCIRSCNSVVKSGYQRVRQ